MRQVAAPLMAAMVGLWAGTTLAQERPIEAPRPAATQPASEEQTARPPEKPTAPAVPPDNDVTEVFGPPPPPPWFLLRESDQDYAACKLALSFLGTVYSEAPPQTAPENPDCGIARPVRVERILPDLVLEGGALMRCDTARSLGLWARDFLRPASAALPDAPRVAGLRLGTTYDCRARVGGQQKTAKLSEHAYGNAIDITGFVFDNGETLAIEPRMDTGQASEGFQKAVRHAGCLFFTTVLGPGSNAAHDNHLHFDMAARRGGWRLCE